jgi:hypothetical protein
LKIKASTKKLYSNLSQKNPGIAILISDILDLRERRISTVKSRKLVMIKVPIQKVITV